ncbi:MAG: phosphoribosylformylglycinamidine cyclo-ligase [Alphaproteobacteria bacterium]|nr:phosphoribosylformylglycinamidine cyclo-ligase [Alphaproteobacteria bacterium]
MKNDPYKDAGVDIEAGNILVNRIKPFVKSTDRAGVMGGFGGFGSFFDPKAAGFKDPIFVSGTDGVGTKLKIAIETKKYDTIGIDLVAMCVNDLLVQGAEPLFFLDYYACGALNVDSAAQVIKGIAKGCELSNCALIGGETAEMPGMYSENDFDLAGFAVGAVEREKVITGQNITEGNVILGLASNGVHSNGFSLVRKIVEGSELSYSSPAPYDPKLNFGQCLLEPTRLYINPVLKALKEVGGINGMAHITGGGLSENIPRCLPENMSAFVDLNSWSLPPLFQWLQSVGDISQEGLLRTFNCGIGYVLVVESSKADELGACLENSGETVYRIGYIKERSEVNKEIQFSGKF